jgi:general secretion pathway protein D
VPTTSTVTSIEFRDTGVKLTVEPSIKLGNELGLKMKIEVIRLGEQVTLQASPPITQFKFGNRSAETMLSIKDGETIILGGLLQEEDRKTRVTVPWIGDLPLIGDLISSFRTDRVTTEVILTITPHIVQNMTPPSLSTQTFWSGTESTYATSPLFSGSANKERTSFRNGFGENSLSSSSRGGGLENAKSSRLFEQMAVPDPLLTIRPEESAIRSGNEIKLAVIDGRIAVSDQAVFRLEYDPKVLQFKRLGEAEIISTPDAQSEESGGGVVGTISFRLIRPTQRAPRTANVTFMAKAPGVSPVRVELVTPGGDSQVTASPVGTGIVRVR